MVRRSLDVRKILRSLFLSFEERKTLAKKKEQVWLWNSISRVFFGKRRTVEVSAGPLSARVVSMSVTTRFAVSADFNFVWQGVEEICMIDAFPSLDEEEDEKAARKAIREKRVLVAEVNGVPAGFLWFVFSKKLPWGVDYGSFKKTFAYSNYVFVGKRFRKKGVGKLLYKEFEGVCKRRGVREIFLDVFWTNSRSRKFHGKTGFKPFTVVYSKKLI